MVDFTTINLSNSTGAGRSNRKKDLKGIIKKILTMHLKMFIFPNMEVDVTKK